MILTSKKNLLKEENKRLRESYKILTSKLDKAMEKITELSSKLFYCEAKNEQLLCELEEKKYSHLYSLPTAGSQGDLFKELICEHEKGKRVKFENLSCSGMYVSDRHPSVYEIVHKIVLQEAVIKNSHFEETCFDTFEFRNVKFENVSFYKALWDDVRFIDCSFISCDFTSSRGTVQFTNCKTQNTDLSQIGIFENSDNEVEELKI